MRNCYFKPTFWGWETLVYNYKGDTIFEGITNINKERFKKILCKHKIDINKRLDTKEIDIKGNAQN